MRTKESGNSSISDTEPATTENDMNETMSSASGAFGWNFQRSILSSSLMQSKSSWLQFFCSFLCILLNAECLSCTHVLKRRKSLPQQNALNVCELWIKWGFSRSSIINVHHIYVIRVFYTSSVTASFHRFQLKTFSPSVMEIREPSHENSQLAM